MSRNRRRLEVRSEGRVVGRIYVHRVIVQRELGRLLLTSEVVHHINGDCLDNRLDNLLLLASQSAHMRIHHWQNHERSGLSHLWSLKQYLQGCVKGKVLWGTLAGITAVFGDEDGFEIYSQIETAGSVATRRLRAGRLSSGGLQQQASRVQTR